MYLINVVTESALFTASPRAQNYISAMNAYDTLRQLPDLILITLADPTGAVLQTYTRP